MFPIIAGIDERIRTTGSGTFHCPNCGANREYRCQQRAQYFYLFFIPVVPLNEWPEQVLCKNCYSKFPKSALICNPEFERQQRDERPERIKLVMILTLLRADRISPAALQHIEDVFLAESGEPLLREDLEREIAEARAMQLDPLVDLVRIAQKFPSEGAFTVLKYACLATCSGGTLSDNDHVFLQELSYALGISEPLFLRIVAFARENTVSQRLVSERPQP